MSGRLRDPWAVRHRQDLFVGEVVAVQLSEEVLDEQGRLDNGKLKPILFTGGEYWGLGDFLGRVGSRRK